MESYSLFELNEHVRRIMALNFQKKLWVKGEIAQVSESKGHFYLNLIQKAEEGEMIVAESQAVIWGRDHRRLQRKFKKELTALLQEGVSVLLKVKVDYHERYGLKLVIEDIDPAYSLGQLELQKRETIATLEKLQLFDLNRILALPPVIQKIALISSEKAAGLQDYITHLQENAYGYYFNNYLFPASVQGVNAEREILHQLKRITLKADRYDCVVIIRGGGSRLDLKTFDSLELSKAVAACPLPVVTGIGHDINESVLDLVAHTALKTPTAVADFLIQKNLHFESHLHLLGQELRELVQHQLNFEQSSLEQITQIIRLKSEGLMATQNRLLDYIKEEIPRQAKRTLKSERQRLNQLEQITQLLSPEQTLKRGFSITMKNGKVIQSIDEVKTGDTIQTILKDGTLETKK